LRCRTCKQGISGRREQQRAVEVKDDAGRLVGYKHFKCAHIDSKHRGKRHYDTPTAYQMSQGVGRVNKDDLTPEAREKREKAEAEYTALLNRRKQIEEQRSLEEVPSRWDDWRDPTELDLDELIEAVEELRGNPSSET
jgi:hypothetical protein